MTTWEHTWLATAPEPAPKHRPMHMEFKRELGFWQVWCAAKNDWRDVDVFFCCDGCGADVKDRIKKEYR